MPQLHGKCRVEGEDFTSKAATSGCWTARRRSLKRVPNKARAFKWRRHQLKLDFLLRRLLILQCIRSMHIPTHLQLTSLTGFTCRLLQTLCRRSAT